MALFWKNEENTTCPTGWPPAGGAQPQRMSEATDAALAARRAAHGVSVAPATYKCGRRAGGGGASFARVLPARRRYALLLLPPAS
jgi:hypothetical protein